MADDLGRYEDYADRAIADYEEEKADNMYGMDIDDLDQWDEDYMPDNYGDMYDDYEERANIADIFIDLANFQSDFFEEKIDYNMALKNLAYVYRKKPVLGQKWLNSIKNYGSHQLKEIMTEASRKLLDKIIRSMQDSVKGGEMDAEKMFFTLLFADRELFNNLKNYIQTLSAREVIFVFREVDMGELHGKKARNLFCAFLYLSLRDRTNIIELGDRDIPEYEYILYNLSPDIGSCVLKIFGKKTMKALKRFSNKGNNPVFDHRAMDIIGQYLGAPNERNVLGKRE